MKFNNSSMLGLRLLWLLNKFLSYCFYKIIYRRKNLHLPWSCRFRYGLNIVIDGKHATVTIGENCFFNNCCSLNCLNQIEIGANTLFGENVKIYDHNHIYSSTDIPIVDQGFTTAPIKIGCNCWIGSNVTILKGVTIGNHCVIGAGCTIYKNVPDNSIVVNKQDMMIKYIK